MPSATSSSASAPFSTSSLPTCGPTNSTRFCGAGGVVGLSAPITVSDSLALDTPFLERQADQHVCDAAEVLHRVLAELELVERGAHAGRGRPLRVMRPRSPCRR